MKKDHKPYEERQAEALEAIAETLKGYREDENRREKKREVGENLVAGERDPILDAHAEREAEIAALDKDLAAFGECPDGEPFTKPSEPPAASGA